ncbi:MAG TPA: PDZ domain-containing protein [Candidatus Baltobacteraceae bacterium]|nr:PDZ domain-containing protein [Candidatus Baltobacteraceae bacterium]
MIGAAMIAVFVLCALLMALRVLPAILAVPLMALGIAAVAGASPSELGAVVTLGSAKLAPLLVTVIFGAWLSRVTMATGIAETIVAYAAEFGGDEPLPLALALCGVVALLFTILSGLGAVVMVGSIVLPILLGVGLDRRSAATLFLLAFALGFIFNITQWTFYTTTFGIQPAQLRTYALVLALIDLLALLIYAFVFVRRSRGYAAWALAAESPRMRVPVPALFTPLLPLGLYYVMHIDPIVAFALAAIFGALCTRPRRAIDTLVAAAVRGVEDVAPALLLFVGIGMLLQTTALLSVRTGLIPLVTALAPHSALGYVLLFGVASPLALYRGPLNPLGVGIAIYAVLAGLGVLPPLVLVAAIMAVVQVQNVCDPTNTQNVWVANFTGVNVQEILRLTLPYQVAVAVAACLVVAFGAQGLFGVPAFAEGSVHETSIAAAAEVTPHVKTGLPGLFIPASAAWAIAVRDDGSDLARAAAEIARRQIVKSWLGYRLVEAPSDPRESDCSEKPYAAVVTFASHQMSSAAGTIVDFEARLADCAGWPVDQWSAARTFSMPPTSDDGKFLGLDLLERLRLWMREDAVRSRALFTSGLAFDPARDAPSELFSMVKTIDGNMRAVVRTGGPAWKAGLRTNDVVLMIDGKYWWDYGTYQAQNRAYSSGTHSFVVQSGADAPRRVIVLAAPFEGESVSTGR